MISASTNFLGGIIVKKRLKIIACTFVALIYCSALNGFSSIAADNSPATLVCPINASQVSQIQILCGYNGRTYKISNKADIEHILGNLGEITFKKGDSAEGRVGFSFATKFYDKSGNELWGCIINSSDTIVYNNYFYKDSTSSIDFDYINNLIQQMQAITSPAPNSSKPAISSASITSSNISNPNTGNNSAILKYFILVTICTLIFVVIIIIRKACKNN